MNIPIEIIQYIDSFVCDKHKKYNNLSIVSKQFKNSPCKISKYKDLLSCSCHNDIHHINAVYKLIYAKTFSLPNNIDNVDTSFSLDNDLKTYLAIHFISKQALNIAKPYLSDFGKVSHYCCSNTGVMYYKKNLIT